MKNAADITNERRRDRDHREVVTELCGLDEDAIADLRSAGVISASPKN